MKEMINGTNDALEKLYFNESWCRVIKHRNHVRIPDIRPLDFEKYVGDEPENIWALIDRDGVNVYEKDNFLTRIKEDPKRIFDYPNDIFALDKDSYAEISGSNGVMLLPNERFLKMPLNFNWEEILTSGDGFSWKSFFGRMMNNHPVLNYYLPSNALILIDRYLFSDFDKGCKNLLDILNSILPDNLNGSYHVLLVIDESAIKAPQEYGNFYDPQSKQLMIGTVITEINKKVIKGVNKTYDIVLEVFTLDGAILKKKESEYDEAKKYARRLYLNETHDRKLLSNYFVTTCTHGFQAVDFKKNGETHANFGQTITFKGIYTGIENELQNQQSLPDKLRYDFVSAVRDFIKSEPKSYKFYRNGSRCSMNTINNRLILSGSIYGG